MECGLCFSSEDWDRGLGFTDFVALVERKAAKPAFQLRLARDRLRGARARLVTDPVKFGTLGLPLLYPAVLARRSPWFIVLLLPWLGLTCSVAFYYFRESRYYERLIQTLEARKLTTA